MSDLNSFSVIGRVSQNPDMRQTKSGKAVVSISIANTTGFGEYEKVSFFNCTAWGKTAEYCANHLNTGDLVSISGQMVIETWEKDGQKRSAPKVNIREINRLRQKNVSTEKGESEKKDDEVFENPFSGETDIAF